MELIQQFIKKAKLQPRKIVYPETMDERILVAASKIKEKRIAEPILVGDQEKITALAGECSANIQGIQIVTPSQETEKLESYAKEYAAARDVKISLAQRLVKKPPSFAAKGSANHKDVDKVKKAVKIAKELKPEFAILINKHGF